MYLVVLPITYELWKIGVLGKAGAYKVMLMAAIAFNRKKYLKRQEESISVPSLNPS
ncbi:hypothetical protein [Pedobacter sp. L105]|uniref:hypothetical protein n=1 Tax=Pedobacter sp. L105 TaxID=1641871 RepID=UPI00131C8CE3|nr:hypothetical protein [Pedobacter sp. L105]